MMKNITAFLLTSTIALAALSFGNSVNEINKNSESNQTNFAKFSNKIDYSIQENFLLKLVREGKEWEVREGKEWENGSSNQILLLDWKKYTENQTW